MPLSIIKLLFVLLMSLCLHGCLTTPQASKSTAMQIAPSLHYTSAANYQKKGTAIELPQNYSTRNYKRLVVAVNFFPHKDASNFRDAPVETLSTAMETEISKLQRFTIVSRHLGQRGKMAEKAFQDIGTTEARTRMRFGQGLNAEYGLVGGVIALKEEYGRGSKNELVYIVRVDYQLIDFETDEIIEADLAEGRAIRTIMRLPSGNIIGGFDQRAEDDAYMQACINALKVITNKIGNKLPVGGQVMGIRGDRFSIDRGYNEGLMGEQTVTLYVHDMGIDLPFAVGEISPGADQTSGRIIRWTDDKDIQDIVQMVRSNPSFVREREIFAVSNGMPLPPEWEHTYSD